MRSETSAFHGPRSRRERARARGGAQVVPEPDPSQDGAVIYEVRAGYRLGERVVRRARVRVGQLFPSA